MCLEVGCWWCWSALKLDDDDNVAFVKLVVDDVHTYLVVFWSWKLMMFMQFEVGWWWWCLGILKLDVDDDVYMF